MKSYDYAIIQKGPFHVLVVRDKFTVGVFTCNSKGIIIPPGNRLLKTHLTYEQNFVSFRHIVGKMRNKPEAPGTYFGATDIRVNHKMELIDELKRYDDISEREIIYASDEVYESVDGSNLIHMHTARKQFEEFVDIIQEWLAQDANIKEKLEELKCQ